MNDRRAFSQALWVGSDEIASNTILLRAEQGLGDTMQFSRYNPRVVAPGARVILEVLRPCRVHSRATQRKHASRHRPTSCWHLVETTERSGTTGYPRDRAASASTCCSG